VRIERERENVFTVRATGQELSALVAAAPMEVAAVAAVGRAGDRQSDHLLVLIRNGGLVGELERLEARPLTGQQIVRDALEEFRHEPKRLLHVPVS
jgi:hypothetical protein